MDNKEFRADKIERLDVFLSRKLNQTRNQIENFIKNGYVTIKGKKKVKSGYKLKIDDIVQVVFPNVQETAPLNVDFDVQVVYEDQYFMVVNKPAGVVVHPAQSVKEPTLVDWLKQQNISLSTISGEQRHGIVHRIDKGTSGLLVVAKTNEAHIRLSKQLEDKTMGRYYLCFIQDPLKSDVVVQTNIARDPKNRLKMANLSQGRYAKTNFIKLQESNNQKYELICAKLFTGRTHQIRVHLKSLHRIILGDLLYGFKGNMDKIRRVYLHAYNLYLQHPVTNEKLSFVVDMPDDMQQFYNKYFNKEFYNEIIDQEYIISRFDSFY